MKSVCLSPSSEAELEIRNRVFIFSWCYPCLYKYVNAVIDIFFSNNSITIKERDPLFMTAIAKHLLRRRSRLLRKNQVEAASSLSTRINRIITQNNTITFERTQRGSRELWNEVNRLRAASGTDNLSLDGVPAASLNQHHGHISKDEHYSAPYLKSAVVDSSKETEDVFTTWKCLQVWGHSHRPPKSWPSGF